jgi:SulP family sulfate permease
MLMTAPALSALKRYVPLIDTVRGYRRRDFERDLVAGIVVGVITVPQAVAYAFLAGAPPEAGLYGCLLPTLLYALLGTSRQLSVGPVAIPGIMVATVLARHGGADAYPAITAVLGIEVAVCLWLLRVAQMEGVVNLLSQPVLSGFINASALLIIVSQLRPFLGLEDTRGGNVLDEVSSLVNDWGVTNPVALALGVGALVVLWVMRRYGYFLVIGYLKRVGRNHSITRAGPLIALALSIVCVAAFDLDTRYGVATVGAVPSGLPSLTMPPFDIGVWLDVFPSAGLIALVVFVESYSLAATFAARNGKRIDTGQELLALGAANLGGAFTGAFPAAGSFSRSGVNFRTGARTQVSSLVAVVVIVAALWLTPLFADLAHAVLAAIVIAAVADLIDFESLRDYWSFYPTDTITHVATMLGVLLFGVEIGLLLGVLIAIAFFIRHSSLPNVVVVGRVGDSSVFRNVERYQTQTHSHVAAVRVDENLYFANANEVETRLMEIATRAGVRHLLLVCSAINFIDTSGLAMLQRVNDNLSRMGIRFHLSDVKGSVMDRLKKTRFAEQLTGSIFFSTDLAMRDLEGADR